MHGGLANHITRSELRSDNTLHVIGVFSNPVRYHSRYRLAREWIAQMEATPHVRLYIVESAFGDRHHELTDASNERHLQLRTKSEIWSKENQINLGVRDLLPRDWRYVAWVDGDVRFCDSNWAQETMHQLQHCDVIQPWQQCSDLGPAGNIMQVHQSIGWLTSSGQRMQRHGTNDPYPFGHSGFAWAATRRWWERVGGLIDWCILGSADAHMAWAMLGDVGQSVHSALQKSFMPRLREWQSRAMSVTHGRVGFTSGRIEHSFHGPKARRFYKERWQILIDHGYDPERDLYYDEQGMIQLAGKPGLEHAIRMYNRSRAEDSIEER